MAELYGRFSIGCWIDPDSLDEPGADDYFDDREKMIAEARRLLRAGRFKSIVFYEWHPTKNAYIEIEELTQGDL